MPLEVRNIRAVQEYVLAGPGSRLFLLDLQLHHFGRVLDDLGNIGPVTGADFTENALIYINESSTKPVTLFITRHVSADKQ